MPTVDNPRPNEVWNHLVGGGVIERRSTPAAPVVPSAANPPIAARLWGSKPDEALRTERLVVLPGPIRTKHSKTTWRPCHSPTLGYW